MTLVLSVLLGIGIGVISLVIAQQTFLFLVSLPAPAPRPIPWQADPLRLAVVVPAHNEELLIGEAVDSLRASDYPADRLDIVVIADNCTDRTAEIARDHGARCLERFDDERRGKPYALDWAFNQLELPSYDGFVILDADTTVAADFFRAMDRELRAGWQAMQGYFGVLNPDENWLTRLSLVPGILKFRFHYRAKNWLGLSCALAGNGMCFSRSVIERFGWNAFSLTENWEYYVQLTLAGVSVRSVEDAVIHSQVARSLSAGTSQRSRWLKGRLWTVLNYWRPLLLSGRPSCWDALFEVARPSHSMVLIWSILLTLLGTAGAAMGWTDWGWAGAAAVLMALQVGYFLAGFAVQRPPLRTWAALFMVPVYLAWKLLVSIRGVLGYKDKAWVRTERHQSKQRPQS